MLHMGIADRVSVVTGKELGPGGVTLRGVVELGEAQTVLCELVEVGGLDFPAIAADVGVPHVIDHNQDKVGKGAFMF